MGTCDPDRDRSIFIVGLYKCGTSWLLRSLAAHPSLIGVREVDLAEACYRDLRAFRLRRPRRERMRRIFGGSAWCHIPAPTEPTARAQLEQAWSGAADTDLLSVLRAIESGARPIDPQLGNSADLHAPMQFFSLSDDAKLRLFGGVARARDLREIVDAFHAAMHEQGLEYKSLVFKAADQISRIERLLGEFPDAPKVIVMRDGRDAAISALHYKQLMAERGATWLREADMFYEELLGRWAINAAAAAKLRGRPDVYILRYEDLSTDFAGTFAALLNWLGMDASTELVEEIQSRVSFEAVTGRQPGEAARDTVRRGMVGEWRETLDPSEQAAAWKVAGEALETFGYSRE